MKMNFRQGLFKSKFRWSLKIKPFIRSLRQGFSVLIAIGLGILIVIGILYVESQIMGETWGSLKDFIREIRTSGILGAVESISIITGLFFFLTKGIKEGKERSQYEALKVIDAAGDQPNSQARIKALENLNNNGFSLEGIVISKVNLTRINLEGAYLEKANLEESKLEEANLRGANLWLANLQQASLRNADFEYADFWNANLQHAKFGATKLMHANFEDANLEKASLTNCKINHAVFKRAKLQDTNFRGADLRDVDFQEAELQNTIFDNANIQDANFQNSKNLQPDQVKSAQNWKLAKYEKSFYPLLDI